MKTLRDFGFVVDGVSISRESPFAVIAKSKERQVKLGDCV